MGLQPLLIQFATWRFVKEENGARVSYLLSQGVPRFVFCYPSTPLRAVVSQISDFLTVEYRRSIVLMQNRMKAATAALIVKRQQAVKQAEMSVKQAEMSVKQAVMSEKQAEMSVKQAVRQAEMSVKQAVKKEGAELSVKREGVQPEAEAAKRREVTKSDSTTTASTTTTTATAVPGSPLKIRVKVKTERPAGKSPVAAVLESPEWNQPDRTDGFPRLCVEPLSWIQSAPFIPLFNKYAAKAGDKTEKRKSFLDFFFTKKDLEQRVDHFFSFSERIPELCVILDVDDGKDKLLRSSAEQDALRNCLLQGQRSTTEKFTYSMDPLLARKLSEKDCPVTLQTCLFNMMQEKKSEE